MVIIFNNYQRLKKNPECYTFHTEIKNRINYYSIVIIIGYNVEYDTQQIESVSNLIIVRSYIIIMFWRIIVMFSDLDWIDSGFFLNFHNIMLWNWLLEINLYIDYNYF